MTTPLAYSVKQAAALIGVGLTTTYALINSGELEAIKIGTRTLIPHASLEKLIERSRNAA